MERFISVKALLKAVFSTQVMGEGGLCACTVVNPEVLIQCVLRLPSHQITLDFFSVTVRPRGHCWRE